MTLAIIFIGIAITILVVGIVTDDDPVSKHIAWIPFLLAIWFAGCWAMAVCDYGNMEGTLHSLPAYEQVIEDTGAIRYKVPESSIMLYNSGEVSLGTETSERMVEWRDRIEEYNRMYGRYKMRNSIRVFRLWIPPMPDTLGYIDVVRDSE